MPCTECSQCLSFRRNITPKGFPYDGNASRDDKALCEQKLIYVTAGTQSCRKARE